MGPEAANARRCSHRVERCRRVAGELVRMTWSAAQRGLCVFALGLCAMSNAQAQAFSWKRSIALGKPAKPANLVVEELGAEVVLRVDQAKATLPIAAPQRVDVQAMTLAGGQALAIVRVT